jgi:uncharacterized protein YciI
MALTMLGGFLYFLVCLRDPPGRVELPDVDHEAFIDVLTAANVVLLGGPFPEPPAPGLRAAYLLRCGSQTEAEALAATDPMVAAGAAVTVHAWDLMAINPEAIDQELVVRPGDIQPGTTL